MSPRVLWGLDLVLEGVLTVSNPDHTKVTQIRKMCKILVGRVKV